MVDMRDQYDEPEVGTNACLNITAFINDPAVKESQKQLKHNLELKHALTSTKGPYARSIT